MMSSLRQAFIGFSFALILLSLNACGGGSEDASDVIWEPPLSSPSGGDLNLGPVNNNEEVQAQITAINNTDEVMTFEIEVDLDAAEGWIVSSPPAMDIEPGDPYVFGPRFRPNANTPMESQGTVTFFYDSDQVVTWIVRGSRAE